MTKHKKMNHEHKRIKHASEEEVSSELNTYFDRQPFFDGENGLDEDANLVMRIMAKYIVKEVVKSDNNLNDSARCVAAQAAYCAMVLLGNKYMPKIPIHKSFRIDEGYLFLGWNMYRKIM